MVQVKVRDKDRTDGPQSALPNLPCKGGKVGKAAGVPGESHVHPAVKHYRVLGGPNDNAAPSHVYQMEKRQCVRMRGVCVYLDRLPNTECECPGHHQRRAYWEQANHPKKRPSLRNLEDTLASLIKCPKPASMLPNTPCKTNFEGV